MGEFDSYKEIKYILAWLTIVSITIGIAIFLKLIVYLIIIVILLIFIYLKSREAEHYKNQVLKLEKNGNGKKKTE